MAVQWAVGVTSCRERVYSALYYQTFKSLKSAGFFIDHYFYDDAEGELLSGTTNRKPGVKAYGNWLLSLAELLVRFPKADRYAVFQDDLIMSAGVREYLDSLHMPDRGYWNLYTFRADNEQIISGQPDGWYEGGLVGDGTTNQVGRGALALVFSQQGVLDLLSHRSMWLKAVDHGPGATPYWGIDGAVVTAMNALGYREYVHAPSLVQHMGCETGPDAPDPSSEKSTIRGINHKQAKTFRGEQWDARCLISKSVVPWSTCGAVR